MSDHCRSCIEEFNDFEGVTPPDVFFLEGKAALVLCEGCGPAQIDPEGYCLGGCAGDYHTGEKHLCHQCTDRKFCKFHDPDVDG